MIKKYIVAVVAALGMISIASITCATTYETTLSGTVSDGFQMYADFTELGFDYKTEYVTSAKFWAFVKSTSFRDLHDYTAVARITVDGNREKTRSVNSYYSEISLLLSDFTSIEDDGIIGWVVDSKSGDIYVGARGYSITTELKSVDPVPEPATMLLFGTGIAGLVGSRVRRKKKA